jgi:hypothetical protein
MPGTGQHAEKYLEQGTRWRGGDAAESFAQSRRGYVPQVCWPRCTVLRMKVLTRGQTIYMLALASGLGLLGWFTTPSNSPRWVILIAVMGLLLVGLYQAWILTLLRKSRRPKDSRTIPPAGRL